jgi:hypothetical protein
MCMPVQRVAWQEAARVFLLSRLVIVLITLAGISVFPLAGQTTNLNCFTNPHACLMAWYHWDAIAYVNVADHAYRLTRDTVFFPLFPIQQHALGVLFGGTVEAYYAAGLVLANLFFYLALVVLYSLISEDFEPTVARNALFYLSFYPYALFFFAGYAESLFVLLCLLVFLLLRRKEPGYWWAAGLAGFFAALTRPTGVILVVPFLVLALQRAWKLRKAGLCSWPRVLNMLAPTVCVVAGVGVFMLYLGLVKGNPFVFSTEQVVSWKRHLAFPWSGIFSTLHLLVKNADQETLNLFDLTFTLLPLAVLLAGWRRLPLHYSLFAAAMAIFVLLYPMNTVEPLTSAPRHMMVIFPVIVILALWGKRPAFNLFFIACSLPIFTINTILFIIHHWVA